VRALTLVLVPTELELHRFQDLGGLAGSAAPALLAGEPCGFGAVRAAARTAQLVARHSPERVVLVGIAGAYDVQRDPIGSALAFARVALDGIGAGEGRRFLGPSALGFTQWPAATIASQPGEQEALALWLPRDQDGGLLLTTCAASASRAQTARRRERFPAARAEDMEGFSVALACSLANVPCAIVRGISNRVGQRDPARWRIPQALAAARRLLLDLLARDAWAAPS
jgi:futalosine hydrolase